MMFGAVSYAIKSAEAYQALVKIPISCYQFTRPLESLGRTKSTWQKE
jgi:hypothetical protein